MTAFSEDVKRMIAEELSPLKVIEKFRIEIGVWDTSSDRKIWNEDKSEQVEPKGEYKGVSNAQIMYFHEFGTLTVKARPILQKTIDWGYKELYEYYMPLMIDGILNKGWGEREVEFQLGRLARRMEDHCKEMTQKDEFGLERLSPKTIARRPKHSDVPLWDTGQLVQSIKCRVSKN